MHHFNLGALCHKPGPDATKQLILLIYIIIIALPTFVCLYVMVTCFNRSFFKTILQFLIVEFNTFFTKVIRKVCIVIFPYDFVCY